ncbi:MAG TPA: hypothetical protein VGM50_08795 [Gemmatimonadaceae bacterium]
MRTVNVIGMAAVAIASAASPARAQSVSNQSPKCARVLDTRITPLAPNIGPSGLDGGALCPSVVDFTARVHLNVYPL